MPRIPYFDMAEADEALRKAVETRPPLNIYRMLAHSGPAAVGFLKTGRGAAQGESTRQPTEGACYSAGRHPEPSGI